MQSSSTGVDSSQSTLMNAATAAPVPVAVGASIANNNATANTAPMQIGGVPITADHLRKLLMRLHALKAEGHTTETSSELNQLTRLVASIQNHHAQKRALAAAQAAKGLNGTPSPASNGPPPTNATPTSSEPVTATSTVTPPAPSPSPPIVAFTPEQLASLKCQIQAFKLLSRNLPVPPAIKAAIFNPAEAVKYIAAQGQSAEVVTDSSAGEPLDANGMTAQEAKEHRDRLLAEEAPLEQVENPDSLVYPYNSFITPREMLENSHGMPSRRTQFIPNLFPPGLDAQTLANERNRFIAARVQQRILELESFPSTMGQDVRTSLDKAGSAEMQELASQKLRALVELKSLHLLQKQKALREDVVRGLNYASSLSLPADRPALRRSKKQTLRDARLTETLERKQKQDREKRAKQKHLDHLQEITTHGTKLVSAHTAHRQKFQKLGKTLLKFHADAEKEEQRRVERVSKERLKALRADDEEGYLKLIDTAKDTRITHLLRQTDAFLDSLAAAVEEQQNDAIRAETKGKGAASAAPMSEASAGADAMAVDGERSGQDATAAVDGEARFGAQPVFEEEAAKDKVDYYNVAHRLKETITEQPSILVGGQLKAYQLKGLEWMVSLYNNHVNGILADEMGLGKTIQTLSLITFLIESKKQNGPYLVIVPLSTMPNWISEFEKWAPSVKMISYKGTPQQRKNAQWEIRQGGFQVLLTTYEYIIKDRPLLAKIKWLHMIIDEGHRMKNSQSKLSQTLTQYYSSRYRLILTGTPLQNNLPELWALLNFVLPKIFGSVKSFDEWFNAPFANTGGQDKIEINEEESLLVIRRLHKVLRPFLLRRLKKDVESDLPDKVERVIKCKMSSLQLKLTKQIKEHGMIFTEMGNLETDSKPTGIKGLQNQIMQLRKICNHPFTFPEVDKSIDPTGGNDATLFRVSGKFELLDRILPKLFQTGHRVLMFFQMTVVMTIFEDYLNFRRIPHLRLDGTTKHEERSDLLQKFNKENSEYPIFILSTRAGGLGLNLQSADTVIIFDSDWNPHQDLQAQDRAHRIGQKKEVRILRLVTERSVEEQVMAGASRKIEMDKKVIQAGRYDNKSTAEERDEFLRALLEAGDEDPDEEDDVDEAEALNEAIARTDEERAIFTKLDRDRKAAEEAAWYAAGHTGKMPERLIQEHELPEVYRMEHVKKVEHDEITDGSRRARNTVQYDDGMTEEQWLKGMEEDDDDSGTRKRSRAGRPKKPMVDRIDIGSESEMTDGSRPRRSRHVIDSDDDGASPRKRYRGSRAPSMTPSVDSDDSRAGGKRRKAQLNPHQENMKRVFDEILTEMENLDNPIYKHQCTGLFNQLPSKTMYPDYYVLIRQPISLAEIKRKINRGQYPGPDAFKADVTLMLNNAMTYNAAGSTVFEDARMLLDLFNREYARRAGQLYQTQQYQQQPQYPSQQQQQPPPQGYGGAAMPQQMYQQQQQQQQSPQAQQMYMPPQQQQQRPAGGGPPPLHSQQYM